MIGGLALVVATMTLGSNIMQKSRKYKNPSHQGNYIFIPEEKGVYWGGWNRKFPFIP